MTTSPQAGADRRDAWEASYARHENFVFVPAEEVVRFFARHLRKRVGLDEVVDVGNGKAGQPMIDAGCGIGRNLQYGCSMGLRMHGIDLSQSAVDEAKRWLAQSGYADAVDDVVQGSLLALPWSDGYFAHALSDSVLDSMPFEMAKRAIEELARVVRPDGLLYCNLISGDQTGFAPDFDGEVVVDTTHEHGTIQSYFTLAKARRLLEPHFRVEEAILARRDDAVRSTHAGRWHLVARRTSR